LQTTANLAFEHTTTAEHSMHLVESVVHMTADKFSYSAL